MTFSRAHLLLAAVTLGAGLAGCAPPPPPVVAPPTIAAPGDAPPAAVVVQMAEPGTTPRAIVNAEGPPTMSYQDFLPELTDEPRRQMIWGLFLTAEARAYAFDAPGQWMPLRHIDYVDELGGRKKGDWNTSGRIQLVGKTDIASLFHEIFHSAFHRSYLRAGADAHWNEAFCDAFRYTQEKELLPSPASTWAKRIDEFALMNMEQAQAAPGNYKWKFVYVYPAAIVVRRSGGTSQGLYALWNELVLLRQRTGSDVLDQYFGYPMAKINEIVHRAKAAE
jgi:hypothetical protein